MDGEICNRAVYFVCLFFSKSFLGAGVEKTDCRQGKWHSVWVKFEFEFLLVPIIRYVTLVKLFNPYESQFLYV